MPSLARLLLPALLADLALSARAAVQNVGVGAPLPRFSLIKPGTRTPPPSGR